MIFAVLEDWYHHIVHTHSCKLVSSFYIYNIYSSKRRANIELAQAGLLEPAPGSNVGPALGSQLTADHVLYRPFNYNPPAFVISMLITIERLASCWMFARSCKHPIMHPLSVKALY